MTVVNLQDLNIRIFKHQVIPFCLRDTDMVNSRKKWKPRTPKKVILYKEKPIQFREKQEKRK